MLILGQICNNFCWEFSLIVVLLKSDLNITGLCTYQIVGPSALFKFQFATAKNAATAPVAVLVIGHWAYRS